MTLMDRRNFCRGAILALGSGLLPGSRALAIPPIGRTRPSHLKLSLAAYSFRQYLTGKSPKMTLEQFIDIAADNGLDGVELTSYYFPENVTEAYLHELRHYAFLRGLDVSSTAVGNNFCLAPGPERDAQLALVRTWIDRAAALDAPVIRIFAGTVPKGGDEQTAVTRAVEGIQTSLLYAQRKGITLALENHGGITSTPSQLLRLVKAVDSPNFGVNLDTGNFHGVNPYADLEELAPYAVNVQVKTELSPNHGKAEPADLARVIGILRDAKYSGYVVLEYEAEEDPKTAVPRHLKELRKLIGTG